MRLKVFVIAICWTAIMLCAVYVFAETADAPQVLSGASGDGVHDDTAALQTAIDSVAATQHFSNQRGRVLYIPDGKYRVSKLQLKCDIVCRGLIDGDVEVNGKYARNLVLDGLNVSGRFYLTSSQDNVISNFHINRELIVSNPSNDMNCCYNVFRDGRASRIMIDVTDGWVNMNTFENVVAFSDKKSFSLLITGRKGKGTGQAHANVFRNCDFSYSRGICNNSETNQYNILDGVYYEGGSKLFGHWHQINCHSAEDSNTNFEPDLLANSLNGFGSFERYGGVADQLALSLNNQIRGGDYSEVTDGLPRDYIANERLAYSYVPAGDNPCGGANVLKITADRAGEQQFAPLISGTGFVSGVIVYQGKSRGLMLSKADESDAFYYDDGREDVHGWRILRFSRYVQPGVPYVLHWRLGAGQSVLVGGIFASSGAVTCLPQTARSVLFSGHMQVGFVASEQVKQLVVKLPYRVVNSGFPQLTLSGTGSAGVTAGVEEATVDGLKLWIRRTANNVADLNLSWQYSCSNY